MKQELFEKISKTGGFYEFDYSDPQDAALVLASLGGEERLKKDYPAVYEAFLSSVERDKEKKEKNSEPVQKVGMSINTFTAVSDEKETRVRASVAGIFADPDFTAENALEGKAPKPWLGGNLYAVIYNAKNPVEVFCNKSFCFNKTDNFEFSYETETLDRETAKKCAATVLLHAVDPGGSLKTFSDSRPALGDGYDVVDTFSVEDPASSYGNNPVIMLYGRSRGQNEGYINADYYNNNSGGEYYDNSPKDNKLKTIMPLKGKIKLIQGCTFPADHVLHKPDAADPPPLNRLIRSIIKVGGIKVATMYEDLADGAAYEELAKCFRTDMSGAHPTVYFDITRDGGHDWHSDTEGVSKWTDNCLTYLLSGGFVLDVIDPNGLPFMVQFSVTGKAREDMCKKQYYVSDSNQVYVPPVIVHWGCFARDTPVRLASGQDIRMDNLQAGDRVVTADGRAVTFLEFVTGWEKRLLTIHAGNGRIRLTGGHPVLLADGTVKAAWCIRLGDELMTPEGGSRVKEIWEEEYNDQVYNPIFEESGMDGLYILAGGFYCGDFYAQNRPWDYENELTSQQEELIAQFKALNDEIALMR